jgi:glycosyltransferase 2 family protein
VTSGSALARYNAVTKKCELPPPTTQRSRWIIPGFLKLALQRNAHKSIRRAFGRKQIGFAISLAIVLAAAFTLYHLLSGIDFGKVINALRVQPVRNIFIAAGFVAGCYTTLVFYDCLALCVIGRRDVPFHVAAVASFTSFTIGHSLGAATFTGGLIRLRIYSAFGLNVIDVAKIAFLTGMTFWLGNALVLGGALACMPDAAGLVDQLPPWINRATGLSALFGSFCYVSWLARRRRVFGRENWQITLPSARVTLLQIGIGGADLIFVALAMYSLLPHAPAVELTTVIVVFLLAILLGTVSHAPGSLGVLEAVMLIGLHQFPEEELLAALLTFRVLYFLFPLALATVILVLREVLFVGTAARSSALR